jgi:two-component system, NtrC family, response regulator GlrR
MSAKQPLSILVVDDDEVLASAVCDMLEEAGHKASAAIGGAAAVFQLVPNAPMAFELVVADVRMPGLDGLSLYEHIRECRPELASRFVFITGGRVDAAVADTIGDGGARLVQKPFSSEELLDAVNGAAEISGAQPSSH